MPRVRTQNAIKGHRLELTGFSLVEVLVVVMVILIIAAIAIPSLVHARMRANEAAALASVKTIQTAEVMYSTTYPEVGYSDSLAKLGSNGSNCETVSRTNACIIMDEALTSGLKSGFIFEVIGDGNTPDTSYSVTATPESSASGRCAVGGNQGGELHFVNPNATSSGGRLSLGSGGNTCD